MPRLLALASLLVLSITASAEEVPPAETAKRAAIAASIAAWNATHPAAPAFPEARLPAAKTSPKPPTIGAVAASSGTAAQWSRIELAFAITTASAKPFEPDPKQGGIDVSATFTLRADPTDSWAINGFYDSTLSPSWRVRFAPDAEGMWDCTVTARDANGTRTVAGPSFECTAATPGSHGWARVDGSALRFVDGTAFWGIGHNNGWQPDVEIPSAPTMRGHGENLLSFWMAEPWALVKPDGDASALVLPSRAPLEPSQNGIGSYNLAACAYLDGVVARAEAAGLYLLPALWAHDELQDATSPWGARNWSNNAYSAICSSVPAFFQTTDRTGAATASWRYQQNRYRYILARWGCSTAIIGWVGLVELDGCISGSNANGPAWCRAVRGYFASHDRFRANASGQYPLAVSKSDTTTGGAVFDPGIDERALDSYLSQNDDIAIAATIAGEARAMSAGTHPALHTEFGAQISSTSAATEPTHMRNGVWAGLASGAALCPLKWCDGGQWPLVQDDGGVGTDLLAQYQILSRFVSGLPYLGNPTMTAADPSYDQGGLRGWGQRLGSTDDCGFAWTQSTTGSIAGGTMTIGGVAAGAYLVEWYHPSTGAITSGGTVATSTDSGGSPVLALTLPVGGSDVAVRYAIASAMIPPLDPTSAMLGIEMSPVPATSPTPAAETGGHACGLGGGLALLAGCALLARRRR